MEINYMKSDLENVLSGKLAKKYKNKHSGIDLKHQRNNSRLLTLRTEVKH